MESDHSDGVQEVGRQISESSSAGRLQCQEAGCGCPIEADGLLHCNTHAICSSSETFGPKVCTICYIWIEQLLAIPFVHRKKHGAWKNLNHRFVLARKSVSYHGTIPFQWAEAEL